MSYIREAFAAAKVLTLVRLLTGVSANVDSEGAALDEALATAGDRARVGALVGVDSVMALKIRLAVEALYGNKRLAWVMKWLSAQESAYLVTRVPVALEGTSGRLVLDKFKKLHCV